MELADVLAALEEIAPTRYAESWDNVGLLVGDPQQDVTRAMLAIDYTPDVAQETASAKCDLVIAYHPPIFEAIKRVTGPGLIFDAIRRGVAIFSPHTALDVAEGGTNDMLADMLRIDSESRRPLRLIEPKAREYKLITFVPEAHLDAVSDALFNAGAGQIGDYTHCSFRSSGTGTFLGGGGTNPTVGRRGQLERAPEVRLETVTPIARLADVLAALRRTHPYEEPAFDLVQLAAAPEKLGQGRVGELSAPTPRHEVFARIKRELSIDHLLIAGPTEGDVKRAACCAGACGGFLDDAIRSRADLYLTGEIRHHDALKAAAAGMTVVCTLHSNSERAVLERVAAKLNEKVPQLETIISRTDRDPFVIA